MKLAVKKSVCVVCGKDSADRQECGHAVHAPCKSQMHMFKLRCVGCIPKGTLESKYAANCQLFMDYLDKNDKWEEYQKEGLPPCRKLTNIIKGYEEILQYPPAACSLGRMYHYGHGVRYNVDKALDLFARAGDYALAKQCIGVIHTGRKEYAKAIQAYTESIALDETREAYLNRGSMYMTIGEEKKSFQDFAKVIDMCPKDARAISNLGSWHLKFHPNSMQLAFDLFTKALQIDPELVNARTVLAKLCVMKGDVRSVAEGERLLRSIFPPTLVSLTSLASLLAHKYTSDKNALFLIDAKSLVDMAMEISEDEPDAHCSLADIYAAEGDTARAVETYRFILSKWEHYSTCMNLAACISTTQYDPEVEALYRRAMHIDPVNLDGCGIFAVYLFTVGQVEKARAMLDKGLELNGENPDLLFYRGIVMLHEEPDEVERVKALFEKVLEINPEHSLANFHMARLTKDPTASIAFLVKAAKYDPTNFEKWVHLGSKYYVYAGGDLGRLVSAITSFERALKLRPGCVKITNHIADCWYAIGMHHVKRGDKARAMRAFFKVDMDCFAYEQAAEQIELFKAA